MILKDIGITVTITTMPEYIEYGEYYYWRNWFVKLLLRTFRRGKIEELKNKVQFAVLAETLERGSELIEE